MQPAASVIVTSDYAFNTRNGIEVFHDCIEALARQDAEEPVEFILVDNTELPAEIAARLKRILPSLRLVTAPASSAAELKNTGVRASSAELVAFIDADCVADSGWLKQFLTDMREHPEVAVVTGRTHYGAAGFLNRVMALLSRSYLDQGRAGYTRHVAINNAAFRRAVFLSHPCATEGAHMSLLQAEALFRAGHRVLFDPRLSVRHDYYGWSSEREIRRSLGYGVIMSRLIDGRLRHAWIARLGYASIPLFAALRALHGCWNCLRRRHAYGVAWYELPAAFMLAAITAIMEVPGMLRAVRGRPLGKTAFR
ncbi:MAG TPA: glycosyltransferase family 2 protein [Candidatus Binatia bacterium]|nr:glycosyltransferase family 2 protein [Candidatus Binatia bacterium]